MLAAAAPAPAVQDFAAQEHICSLRRPKSSARRIVVAVAVAVAVCGCMTQSRPPAPCSFLQIGHTKLLFTVRLANGEPVRPKAQHNALWKSDEESPGDAKPKITPSVSKNNDALLDAVVPDA